MAEKVTLQERPKANSFHTKAAIASALHWSKPKLKRSLTSDASFGDVDQKSSIDVTTRSTNAIQGNQTQNMINFNMFSPRLQASTCNCDVQVTHSSFVSTQHNSRKTLDEKINESQINQALDEEINFIVPQERKHTANLFTTRIKDIIFNVLATHLDNLAEFSPKTCGEKCRLISQMIEKSVKTLCCFQYKVMALVFIGAIRDQGIQLASQSYWNPNSDHFTMATYRNDFLFASGIVFTTVCED